MRKKSSLLKYGLLVTIIALVSCDSQYIPNGWNYYNDDIFSIAYPPEIEIKGNYERLKEAYAKAGLSIPKLTDITFQQKGINYYNDSANNNYMRIICHPITSEQGTFLKSNEYTGNWYEISDANEYFRVLIYELILDNCKILDGTSLLIEPSSPNQVLFFWKDINGCKVLQADYTRFSTNGIVPLEQDTIHGQICLLQNDSQAVSIVFACSSPLWDDYFFNYFSPMLHSFRWKNLYK